MSDTGRRQAVALAYEHGDDAAPRVVAKGYGQIADMIVQRARDTGLYVHESSQMVSLLMNVDLDSHVPPLLYQAVAELLAWLYRLEQGDPAAAMPRGPDAAGKNAGRTGPGKGTPGKSAPGKGTDKGSPAPGGTARGAPVKGGPGKSGADNNAGWTLP